MAITSITGIFKSINCRIEKQKKHDKSDKIFIITVETKLAKIKAKELN